MIVEPKVAVENGTEQFYMVREWHDAASDVYITTSWHERSDILARPEDNGFRLVRINSEAIV